MDRGTPANVHPRPANKIKANVAMAVVNAAPVRTKSSILKYDHSPEYRLNAAHTRRHTTISTGNVCQKASAYIVGTSPSNRSSYASQYVRYTPSTCHSTIMVLRNHAYSFMGRAISLMSRFMGGARGAVLSLFVLRSSLEFVANGDVQSYFRIVHIIAAAP